MTQPIPVPDTPVQSRTRSSVVYVAVFAASLLLSLFAYLQRDIINSDGILYVKVARAFVDGGFADAFAVFNWPFFGMLIGFTHQLTLLSYESSAYLLNALFIAIAVTAFVACYERTGREGTRPWLAGALILSLPIINDYRDFIVRDFGYLAFLFLALWFFLRFSQQHRMRDALLWQLALGLAAAFRIEALVFALVPTLYYVGSHPPEMSRRLLHSNAVFLGAVVLGVVVYLLRGATGDVGANLFTLQQWLSYASPAKIWSGIDREAATLHQQLQYLSSHRDAVLVLSSGLLALTTFKLLSNAVIPFCLTAMYGSHKRWLTGNRGTRITWIFVGLAVAAILALVASRFFLSSRYTIAAALLLSLITFAYVDVGLKRLADGGRKRLLLIAWAVIAIMFLDGVISTGASKRVIRTGSEQALTIADPQATWLCNEPRIRFYTDERCELVGRTRLLNLLGGKRADDTPAVLLIWVPRKDGELQEAIEGNPLVEVIESSANRRGDKLGVYRLPAGSN
ncbi:MAG: glycosyltransferase family 39 protein [Gammaproteobacteria bacterium]|nr:glycosyltransferase family 39 protein [Gammaproteobacteria bacterium]